MSLNVTKTVYSYYTPEARAAVDRVMKNYPHDMFLEADLTPLDHFQEPIIDSLVKYYEPSAPHLKRFSRRYPTFGSEEFIKEYLTSLQSRGVSYIYVLRGDYEGYREAAKTRNIGVVEVGFDDNWRSLPSGHVMISNPSARDGNILPDGYITDICEAGHTVFYDMSYIGTTAPFVYNVSHPNIAAVAISFSKPFGLFYNRIGYAFTRKEVTSLYGNKMWFKSIPNLLITLEIILSINLDAYAMKYKKIQIEIVRRVRGLGYSAVEASDVFLLAHVPRYNLGRLTVQQKVELEYFKRDTGYRFCLRPYFLQT